MNREYYVYAHYVKGSSLPFYIGKGKHNRAWDTTGRNVLWNEVVSNNQYEVKILCNDISDVSASIIEEQLVREYGRKDIGTGILTNMTDGGDGCKGHSETIRKVISEQNKQRWKDPKYRNRMITSARRRKKINNADEVYKRTSLALSGGKVYTLVSPSGEEHECINQAEFARVHGLAHPILSAFLKGKYMGGRTIYKGWRVKDVKTIKVERKKHWSETSDISVYDNK